MLSDFLLLETYFEGPETVQFYEDLSRRYGERAVKVAEHAGDLIKRPIVCGPFCGKQMVWLSEQGRQKAIGMNASPIAGA